MFNGNRSNKQEVLDYVFGKMIEQEKKVLGMMDVSIDLMV